MTTTLVPDEMLESGGSSPVFTFNWSTNPTLVPGEFFKNKQVYAVLVEGTTVNNNDGQTSVTHNLGVDQHVRIEGFIQTASEGFYPVGSDINSNEFQSGTVNIGDNSFNFRHFNATGILANRPYSFRYKYTRNADSTVTPGVSDISLTTTESSLNGRTFKGDQVFGILVEGTTISGVGFNTVTHNLDIKEYVSCEGVINANFGDHQIGHDINGGELQTGFRQQNTNSLQFYQSDTVNNRFNSRSYTLEILYTKN